MTSGEIDSATQRRMLAEMHAMAKDLRDHGDGFLAGHYAHIQERIETVLAIMETSVSDIPAAE